MLKPFACFLILAALSAPGAAQEKPVQPAGEAKFLPQPDFFKTLVNPQCSHCIDEAIERRGLVCVWIGVMPNRQ